MSSRGVLVGAASLAAVLLGLMVVYALVSGDEAAARNGQSGRSDEAGGDPATADRPAGPQRPAPATQPTSAPARRAPRPVTPRHVRLPYLRHPRILIEKADHRLTVFDGNRPVKTYRCAVGAGRGDKTREGDRCTPEGQFRVCVKNPASNYTRALGLDYPNAEDARRGLRDGLITRARHDAIVEAVSQGRRPPWNTPLGGEIMIHGAGQGRDWTRGCIALDDADILELYPAIGLHTPVTILP